jgi:hypothetical protein
MYLLDLNDNKLEMNEKINPIVKDKIDILKEKYYIPIGIYNLFLKNTNLDTSICFESDYRSVDIERIFELKESYNHIIDFFYRYIGMGHMELISMCIYTQKFFIRRGGGSNGFEREDNYIKYKDFKLNEKTETFTFEEILDRIKD